MQNPLLQSTDHIISERLQDEAELRRELATHGYLYLHGWSSSANSLVADALAAGFGNVIQVTDVKAAIDSNALVTSFSELDVHTDHSRARYIMWHCIERSAQGGTTVLVDTRPVLDAMSDADRESLQEIYLIEHKVFRDDPSRVPLLRTIDGTDHVYYSFWLFEDDVMPGTRPALAEFRRILKSAP